MKIGGRGGALATVSSVAIRDPHMRISQVKSVLLNIIKAFRNIKPGYGDFACN